MTAFFYWDVISWALSLMLSDRYVNNDGFFVLNLYLNIIHWSFSSMIGRHSVTPNFSIFFLVDRNRFNQNRFLFLGRSTFYDFLTDLPTFKTSTTNDKAGFGSILYKAIGQLVWRSLVEHLLTRGPGFNPSRRQFYQKYIYHERGLKYENEY